MIEEVLEDFGFLHDPNRTKLDKYRDFRKVFLGSDEGRRVLHDILTFGHIYRSSAVRGDPYETSRREGERNIALKILETIHKEPKEQPTKQVTKEPE